MLYTIGYQALTPSDLLQIVEKLDIRTVVDCRSVPSSRRPGFSGKALRNLLGARYDARGDELGGKGEGPTAAGLARLAGEAEGANLLLLCLEEAPGECHRHHRIGLPLARMGVDVHHVYQQEIVTAAELQRSIEAGDDYECEVWAAGV